MINHNLITNILTITIKPKYKLYNKNNIVWSNLSSNPNAIHILENNLDKNVWYFLSRNPNISQIIYNLGIIVSYNSFNNYL